MHKKFRYAAFRWRAGLSLVGCLFLLGCDPERKKQCEWTLEPEPTKRGKTEPGFIPMCARNWVSRKQDCRLETTLTFAKEVAGKKFRYIDMQVASVAIPRKIKEIKFCDGVQKIAINATGVSTTAQHTPAVQPKWKSNVLALFAASPSHAQGWGLLSSGGWADSGQFFVLQNSPKDPAVLYYAPPGAKAWSEPRTITSAEWQIFRQGVAQAGSLSPFLSQVFDGIEYEFFTLYKDGDKTQTREVYMNNPGAFPTKAISYNKLVERFFDLAKKEKLR